MKPINVKRTELAILLITVIVLYWLYGCANIIKGTCANDSIFAATLYRLRTGHPAYIAKSADGSHAQAFAFEKGKKVWLHIYPLFQWGVYESGPDDMAGGIGYVYEVDRFIEVHGWRVK